MKFKLYLTGFLSVVFLGFSFTVLFGTGFLNNIHNQYLRLLSSWTVKLTNSEGNSGATGFIVKGRSGEKYIMTNTHVCGLAQNNMLTAIYKGEVFQVEVYKKYPFNDLCALKAHRDLGLAVHVANSFSYGESTWAIGHPLLEPRSVSTGELSGTVFITVAVKINPEPGECDGPTYHVLDMSGSFLSVFGVNSICTRTLEANASTMSILPGNSGSPVVNLYGSVIGVAFAANESGTRGYIVPLTDLQAFLGEL